MVADLQHSSRSNNTPLWLYSPNGTSAQSFLWVPLGGRDDGYYMILAACSGLALQAASAAPGAPIIQNPWLPNDDLMKWSRVPVGPDNQYFYVRNKALKLYTIVPQDAIRTPIVLGSTAAGYAWWTVESAN